ncbi:hypothetical protein SRHO_G00184680 [Serrasalmus rhombeus]
MTDSDFQATTGEAANKHNLDWNRSLQSSGRKSGSQVCELRISTKTSLALLCETRGAHSHLNLSAMLSFCHSPPSSLPPPVDPGPVLIKECTLKTMQARTLKEHEDTSAQLHCQRPHQWETCLGAENVNLLYYSQPGHKSKNGESSQWHQE